MDWTQVIVTALIVLFGSGGVLVTIIQNGKSHDKKHDKTDANLENLLTEVKQLKDGQAPIKEELSHNTYATKQQIKYTLTRLHRDALIRMCITSYELECAEDLYTEYKRLKGNSFIDKVISDLRKLEIRFSGTEDKNEQQRTGKLYETFPELHKTAQSHH
ncbi:MAG: hypothetical protein LBN40_05230 [Oscillospiraceae bacterium]|jgi:hypothetical protein|nr:hypothetical protein [Oscillospiraceae bacterium]